MESLDRPLCLIAEVAVRPVGKVRPLLELPGCRLEDPAGEEFVPATAWLLLQLWASDGSRNMVRAYALSLLRYLRFLWAVECPWDQATAVGTRDFVLWARQAVKFEGRKNQPVQPRGRGYAAIYLQDVIRHHRTHIAMRRQTRPSEEYREPTAEERAEFEAHFVQRRVSLGTCGRAYGTNCLHEHACLRCALLRPDPAESGRLRDIITNLQDRIVEAEQNNWLGEVGGLNFSLAGAEPKLIQMERQMSQNPAEAFLGLLTARRHGRP